MTTDLIIPSQVRTPSVNFTTTGLLEISGVSMPDNAFEFYRPLEEWLETYKKTPELETFITIKLRYLNSASSGMIYKLFGHLEELAQSGMSSVHCNWYHEEDDSSMEEFIETVNEVTPSLNYEVIAIESVFGISA